VSNSSYVILHSDGSILGNHRGTVAQITGFARTSGGRGGRTPIQSPSIPHDHLGGVVVAVGLTTAPQTANAQGYANLSCGQLWYERNWIFSEHGYCFQTPQANVRARKPRRFVFSIVLSRQPSPALLFFKLIEVETKFPFANSISELSRSQDPEPTYGGAAGLEAH
jgi:hypothetical protein